MTRCPRPFDRDIGAEAGERVPAGPLRELVSGAAGCSPYLAGLLAQESEWLEGAAEAPDLALADIGSVNDGDVATELRRAKRRVALLTGLADLGGVWTLEEVTTALTRFADQAVDSALSAALRPLVARGKIPGLSEDMGTRGLTVLAMGKMGAFELNYSSDIDLICLFDESLFDPEAYATVRSGFVRAVRNMCATLSDTRNGGYVFRTDLRLRPDPSVTPVVMSMAAAERYYESLGRTWERAAFIKARACAGDIAAGARFLTDLTPFVWRKHLDFAAIEDAHNMRLAIRNHKGFNGPLTLPGHNMKLGRGGIREIEFFTQTRQLISGGRDPSLRVPGTVPALASLVDAGWVPAEDAQHLTGHYGFHREVEHRVQMVQDAQTHSLPTSDEGFARLACMMDRDRQGLEQDLMGRLTQVHEITEGFFAPATAQDEESVLAPEVAARWRGYPALRSERALGLFQRIEPRLVAGLNAAARPDEALAAFDSFLSGLPAGVQLFSLFEANPSLVDLLIDILATAPPLAAYLARNANVLDAVIGGDFFTPWPGHCSLEADLAEQLEGQVDYETKLDLTRRWMKEWHFRAGVHLLRGLTNAQEAGQQYADVARACLRGLWPHVVAQFARRHGPPPGRGAVILGMGSVGAGRMNSGSDLDMIVIYDPLDETDSDGPRPLAARTYYARLTQALITALSAQTAEGRLYEVDMRLRPSGNQGPVATSWRAFQDYQRTQAWLWEHLALTRASVLAGPPEMTADVEAFLDEIRQHSRKASEVVTGVSDMRARIFEAKPTGSVLDAKTGPGRLQDIELFVQGAALLAGKSAYDISASTDLAAQVGLCGPDGAHILRQTYNRAWALNIAMRLVSATNSDADGLGMAARAHVLRAISVEDMEAAAAAMTSAYDEAAAVIGRGLQN